MDRRFYDYALQTINTVQLLVVSLLFGLSQSLLPCEIKNLMRRSEICETLRGL